MTSDVRTPPEIAAIEAVAHLRQTLLRQAAQIVCADGFRVAAEHCEPLVQVSALLSSALEGLKVAEEELLQQNEALVLARSEPDARLVYFQRLFDLAPVPLLHTDLLGAIILTNRAAAELFGVTSQDPLTHEPIATFVPLAQRTKFRRELNRVTMVAHVVDWRFAIRRRSDAPIDVSATVRVVDGLGGEPGAALEWCVRPVQPGTRAGETAYASSGKPNPPPMVDRAD